MWNYYSRQSWEVLIHHEKKEAFFETCGTFISFSMRKNMELRCSLRISYWYDCIVRFKALWLTVKWLRNTVLTSWSTRPSSDLNLYTKVTMISINFTTYGFILCWQFLINFFIDWNKRDGILNFQSIALQMRQF